MTTYQPKFYKNNSNQYYIQLAPDWIIEYSEFYSELKIGQMEGISEVLENEFCDFDFEEGYSVSEDAVEYAKMYKNILSGKEIVALVEDLTAFHKINLRNDLSAFALNIVPPSACLTFSSPEQYVGAYIRKLIFEKEQLEIELQHLKQQIVNLKD